MKNKGFITASMITFLPVCLAFLWGTFTATGLMQYELRLSHICRSSLLQTQNKVAPLLTRLLALNPLARKLKIQHERAEKALKMAISVGHGPAIAAAQLKVNLLRLRRLELELQQKELLARSSREMQIGYERSGLELQRAARAGQKATSALLEIQFHLTKQRPVVKLAVRPEYSDLAPPYELESPFPNRQSMEHLWQYRARLKGPMPGHFEFHKGCSVTLYQEREKWHAGLHQGKSTSNLF